MGDKAYHAKPILSVPICNHDTKSQQKTITSSLLISWEEMEWDDIDNILLNIGTDGDSVRRSVLPSLRNHLVDSSSRLYGLLDYLKFLDLWTGSGDLTFDFDGKHLTKRIYNNLLSGSISILGHKFDAATLRAILKATKQYNTSDIEAMVTPVDKQNIPLAFKLFDALCQDMNGKELTPGLCGMFPALPILLLSCNGVLSLFSRTTLSIHVEQFEFYVCLIPYFTQMILSKFLLYFTMIYSQRVRMPISLQQSTKYTNQMAHCIYTK